MIFLQAFAKKESVASETATVSQIFGTVSRCVWDAPENGASGYWSRWVCEQL